MWTSVGPWWHPPFWQVLCWSVTVQKFPDLMNHPTKERKKMKEVTWCGCGCSILNNRSHETNIVSWWYSCEYVGRSLPNHCLETSENPSVSLVFSCACVLMHFRLFWETFMPLPSHGLNAELKYLLVSSYFFMCFFLRHILISNFTCRVLVSLLMLMFSPWWKFFGLESFWGRKTHSAINFNAQEMWKGSAGVS